MTGLPTYLVVTSLVVFLRLMKTWRATAESTIGRAAVGAVRCLVRMSRPLDDQSVHSLASAGSRRVQRWER